MRDPDTGQFISPKDVVKYEITVWNMIDGDILEKNWEATERDLDDIEERYRDEPNIEIEIEEKWTSL